MEKINKISSWFFEKVNKIAKKPLAICIKAGGGRERKLKSIKPEMKEEILKLLPNKCKGS